MLFWVNTLWHLQWLTILDIILLQAVFAIEYCSKPKPISRISKRKSESFVHTEDYMFTSIMIHSMNIILQIMSKQFKSDLGNWLL